MDCAELTGEEQEMTSEEKALALLEKAYDSPSSAQRKKLAQEALELDPDCADAYYQLAQEYQSVKKKTEFYTKGIEAFRRKYGPEFFVENKGSFWGLWETRVYMRLSAGYADLLWETQKEEDAIRIYEELLELNPNDNQGLRYGLLDWLLCRDQTEKAQALLDTYSEATAFMLYSKLLLYIKTDPTNMPKLKHAFDRAKLANPFIVDYLLGRKKVQAVPDYYTPGEESEAAAYFVDSIEPWIRAPGAFDVLCKISGQT